MCVAVGALTFCSDRSSRVTEDEWTDGTAISGWTFAEKLEPPGTLRRTEEFIRCRIEVAEPCGGEGRRGGRPSLAAVFLGVVGGGLVAVLLRLALVPLRRVGVVRRLLVVAGLVVLGRVFVMLARLLVVFGGLLVRRGGFLRHESPLLESARTRDGGGRVSRPADGTPPPAVRDPESIASIATLAPPAKRRYTGTVYGGSSRAETGRC